MEGCFMFQWGASFLSGGRASWRVSVLVGGRGFQKKSYDGGRPPHAPPTMVNPDPHINICVIPPNICVALKQFNLLPPNTSV